MRRRTFYFALMLCIVVLLKLCMPAIAQIETSAEDGFDVTVTTVAGMELPVACRLTIPVQYQEGSSVLQKTMTAQTSLSDKTLLRADITFDAIDFAITDAAWNEVEAWLAPIARAILLNSADMGAETMSESLLRAIRSARAETPEPDANGNYPAWSDVRLVLREISVEAPYYERLARGSRGDAVTALQERLTVLGYLTGKIDGQFGSGTEKALIAAQNDLRAVEQQAIDAKATPTPAPEGAEESAAANEPEPGEQPATHADGVADQAYQIQLYGSAYPILTETLAIGAKNDAVTRVQNRLIALGYLNGGADGAFGETTARALRIFQYYNDIPQTGAADGVTQRVLFSEIALEPDYPLLQRGQSGEAVKRLQQRLILLGFMTGTADGDYGNATVSGVENLQTYMREREIAALTQEAKRKARAESAVVEARPDPTQATEAASDSESIAVQPTIVVNGVADPLLLEDFYRDDFGDISTALRNGDGGGDVLRVQRRLRKLEYVYSVPDGQYGNATEEAVRAFQKRNSLTQSGIADGTTLRLLFSADALKALKPYVLKVSVSKQRVYAYALDANNEHTVLVRTMKCSTGLSSSPTPKGTYQSSTGPGARWHYFKKFYCWAQYAYYIQGDIMFHSVLYNSKGGAVTRSSVNNLGRRASHGCVRLSVEDAKWIWSNCPRNTKVEVY